MRNMVVKYSIQGNIYNFDETGYIIGPFNMLFTGV